MVNLILDGGRRLDLFSEHLLILSGGDKGYLFLNDLGLGYFDRYFEIGTLSDDGRLQRFGVFGTHHIFE